MVTVPIEVLHAAAAARPDGYLRDMFDNATIIHEGNRVAALEFDDKVYMTLRQKYSSERRILHEWVKRDDGALVCHWCGKELPTGEIPGVAVCPLLAATRPLDTNIKPPPPSPEEQDPIGPGTILSQSLALIGITASPTCGCKRKARQMNDWGPDGCDAHMPEILAGLREEAERRKMPFVEPVARLLVQRAIRVSRKKKAAAKAAPR
jgi:hypothetical protein